MLKYFSKIMLICCVIFISACKNQSEIPRYLPDVVIAIAPFNQPTHDSQLLAGYIPKIQGKLYSNYIGKFNAIFKEKLSKTNYKYIFLTSEDIKINLQKDTRGRDNALSTWAKIAQNVNADYIIIPQILDIEERVGDSIRVSTPARLICDIFLVKAYNPEFEQNDPEALDGYLLDRSNYRFVIFPNVENDFSDKLTTTQRDEVTNFVKKAILKAINEFHL